MTRSTLVRATVAVALGSLTFGAPAAGGKSKRVSARHRAQIKVLSTRADLVSGGDALTQIVLPHGTRAKRVRVTVGTRDVTRAFAKRANGKFEGVLTGLELGANVVTARLPGGYRARLTVRNHPIGGPVFAGPQIQPWACQAGAKDAQCNQSATFSYFYEPATGGPLQSYDPSNPPPAGSIATATTTDGVKVPFIVRQETGYIDRDQYAIATLYQPGKPWKPYRPQPQYNGRLVITHGASCDTTYGTGQAPSVQDTKMLGGGFVLMSNALDNAGHNCNLATQAESLEMTKEYTIDHYGEVRWTIGSGCSGGALAQQQVANAYPGIYQGIAPQCSFTDAWSSAMEYEDYVMLLHFFQDPTKWDLGDVFGPPQIQAIIDHPNPVNPVTFTSVIPNSGKATRPCPGVPDSQVYNAQTNPHGVRCTLQDYMVNVFGRRASDGFANRAFDNVGIQYGLKGLRQGLLTPSEFVDLNEHVGGFDIDGNFQAARAVADPLGLERVYRSGAADEASHLNRVAIIDLRGPDPGAFHDVYRTYAMRARLMRNFGTAANQVLWRGQAPLIGDSNYADQAVFALDTWLGRVHADRRSVPLPRKIIEDKPGTIADRCTNGSGTDLPSEVCDQTVSAYGTPRFAADEPATDDILKCQLKPLQRGDYPVAFTDAQWTRLQHAFPNGVCDYSKPGVAQQPTVAWLTYQDRKGQVIYGGRPLGAAPRSRALAPARKHRR